MLAKVMKIFMSWCSICGEFHYVLDVSILNLFLVVCHWEEGIPSYGFGQLEIRSSYLAHVKKFC